MIDITEFPFSEKRWREGGRKRRERDREGKGAGNGEAKEDFLC